MIGKSLGHYEILAPLGSGGMGDVYRARDSSLNRDVAIKVLPEDLADDPDRLARLRREAHLLAALNHPNVATIHGFEESEGTRFLVMELVKGESLEQKLAGGRLPVDEALDICRQIAEALEAAHEEGIIHRDLKPANVLITPDGRAKVLDFGLAKTAEAAESSDLDISHSPTVTVAGTKTGVILGTAPYMSPEQVRGKPVDKRTDIWAFGCVLYEILAGSRAFNRETVADTLAAILEVDPPWDALPRDTPPIIRALLLRCLRKDPNRRLHDIADARIEIEEAKEPGTESGVGIFVAGASTVPAAWTQTTRAVAVLITAVAMAAGGLAVWSVMPSRSPAQRHVYTLELPDDLMRANTGSSHVAVSPDGMHLVLRLTDGTTSYLAQRRMDRVGFERIRGSDEATRAFFSPDSRQIGFNAQGNIKVVSVEGGAPRDLCVGCEGFATWSPANDKIVFARRDGTLWAFPAEGGTPEPVPAPESEFGYGQPSFLPGGEALLLEVRRTRSARDYAIGILDLSTDDLTIVAEVGSDPAYAPSGHVVFLREGSMYAVPFDLGRLRPLGEPTRVLDGVRAWGGAGQYSFSLGGILVYAPARPRSSEQGFYAWVDRTGRTTPLDDRIFQSNGSSRFSRDGQRLVAFIDGELWIHEIESGDWQQLTQGAGYRASPNWTHDGTRIVYTRGFGPEYDYNVVSISADFSDDEALVLDLEYGVSPTSVARDGAVVVNASSPEQQGNIVVLPAEGDSPRDVVRTPFDEHSGTLSPDERWLAYVSNRSGQNEVYVEPFPEGGRRVQVSDQGGSIPRWSADGTELFFLEGTQLMVAGVSPGEQGFPNVAPTMLFEAPDLLLPSLGYDVHPDGERFIMVQATEPQPEERDLLLRRLIIDTNWFEELKRLVPTRR